jgi:hypothetical protein
VIESVAIDGTALSLDDVFAAATIRHGRTGVDDSPLGSTATLALVNVDRAFSLPFRVGKELAVNIGGAVARFRGRITDADLDAAAATLSIIATSTLARISGRKVGAGAWPSETWSARVTRVFTEADALAELALEVGAEDPLLAARAADETTLGAALSELAVTVAAAIADLPNGDVLVQAVSSRQGRELVELDPALVAYAPEWVQTDDVANVVRVEWSGGTVEQTDTASITTFEERAPLTLKTSLALVGDASTRATKELNRRSSPDWIVGRVDLLTLDDSIGIGDPLRITDNPAAAPSEAVIAMVEGWEDHVEPGDDGLDWTMQISLSPQRLSGYGLAWADLPSSITWADAGATTWANPEELLP